MSPMTHTRASVAETRLGRALAWATRNGPSALAEAAVNIALPYLLFTLIKPSVGSVGGLMAGAAPPLGWTLFQLTRHRRIDVLSLLVLGGIAASLIAFFGGGGARFLQLREQLVIALIGVVFLTSAAIGKPLISQLARARTRRRSTEEARALEALQSSPIVRRAMMVMTLAWGVGLVAEAALTVVLVFTLTIPQYLLASPILGYGSIGGLTAWTFWYARRRIVAARAAISASAR